MASAMLSSRKELTHIVLLAGLRAWVRRWSLLQSSASQGLTVTLLKNNKKKLSPKLQTSFIKMHMRTDAWKPDPLICVFKCLWEQGTQPPLWRVKQSGAFQNYILVTAFIMDVLPFIPPFEVIPVDLRTKQCVTFMVEWDQPQIPCRAREVRQCWVIWYL